MPKPCQHYNLSGYLLLSLRVPFSYIIIPISCALQLESEVFCDFTFDCCLLVGGWKTERFLLESFWEINPLGNQSRLRRFR